MNVQKRPDLHHGATRSAASASATTSTA
jgi:hypothetical protein